MLYANAETCGDLKMVAGRWLSPPWPCLVREKKLIITTTLCWANNGQHVWCEGFRGSAGTLPFCHETYCHWSAPGRVPVSSTHTPACPTPSTIPQAVFFFPLCFLFLFKTLLSSFLQSDTIADNSLTITWRRFTTQPPSYKKAKN